MQINTTDKIHVCVTEWLNICDISSHSHHDTHCSPGGQPGANCGGWRAQDLQFIYPEFLNEGDTVDVPPVF